MSRRHLIISLLLLSVGLLVAVLSVVSQAAGGEAGAAPPPPAPRSTDSTWPLAAPVAGPPLASSTTVVSSAATVVEEATTPEPFVQNFAGQSSVSPLPRLPSPTATLSMPVNVDGCDRSYGARSQCVPWRFPPGVSDGCAWLAERGFLDKPLTVRGADRHGLDPDGDGLACSP